MASITLGQAAIVPKGSYSATQMYETLNLVTSKGGSYLSLQRSQGIEPGVTSGWESYWMNTTIGIVSISATTIGDDETYFVVTMTDGTTKQIQAPSSVINEIVWVSNQSGQPKGTPGTVDVYQIRYDNGLYANFTVTNGSVSIEATTVDQTVTAGSTNPVSSNAVVQYAGRASTITITGASGNSVRATDGTTTITGTIAGGATVYKFVIPTRGNWTVTNVTTGVSAVVPVFADADYSVSAAGVVQALFDEIIPEGGIPGNYIADGAITTPKFAADAKAPRAGTADTSGTCTGNAATATRLQTGKTFTVADGNGHEGDPITFNGSQNVVLPLPDTIEADFIGDVEGDVTGNADTATKLQTARNITVKDYAGTFSGTAVSFDGSGNIVLLMPQNLKGTVRPDTLILNSNSYGDTLPTPGTAGRIFFKRED